MVARVLFIWLPSWGNTTTPTGNGSPDLLPDLPASVDAYWATAMVAPTTFLVFCRFELKDNSDLSTQILL